MMVADTVRIETAMRRRHDEVERKVAHAWRVVARRVVRLDDTRGDRHVESIIRDSLERRLPVDDTARRLMVASDIAQILDRRRIDHAALDAKIRDGLSGWGA